MSEAMAAAPSAPTSSAAAASESGGVNSAAQDSTKEAGATAGGAAGEAQPTQQEIKEALEEIKVGSRTLKLSKEDAKLIKDLERGFHSKAQEAAQMRGYFQNLAQQARDNPLVADALFEQLGIDADRYSQARLAKKLELEMMDPNERKAREYEQKLKQYEEQESKRQQAEEQDRMTKAEQHESMKLRQEMMQAWQSSGLPADPKFGAWMAATMSAANEQGLDWTWAQCAAKVREDFRGHVRSVISQMDPEGIQELLGDEPLTKWREHDVKRVTAGSAAPRTVGSAKANGPGGSPASKSIKVKGPMNEQEYREYFERLASEG